MVADFRRLNIALVQTNNKMVWVQEVPSNIAVPAFKVEHNFKQ